VRHRAKIGLVVLLLAGCPDVGEERVERDLNVGKASFGGASVEVRGGLASVRSAVPGEVVLWGQAPVLDLDLATPPGGPSTWKLLVRNALPDAALTGVDASGKAILIEPVATPLKTQRGFSLTVSPGSTVKLRLAPPDADAPGRYRIGVLSDVQEAIDRVGDIYRKVNETPDVRFVLGIGDLTQRGTVEQLERFQREQEAMEVPYFATLGNHELGTDPPPFHDLVGRGNFHFIFRGVHYTLLDSASASIEPTVFEWLDGWLAEGRHGAHIVGMHIPPVDPVGVRNGSFASRAEAAKLLARLTEAGVDLTLYGHIHTYIPFANGGIPAYISGGGGAIPERFDGVGRHFLTVDVNPDSIENVNIVRVDVD